jgi:hypothetical protein
MRTVDEGTGMRGRYAVMLAGCLVGALGTALAAGPFDGTYSGQTKRERGDTSICGAETGHASVTVADSRFSYVWNPQFHVVVTSTVGPDGAVSGSQLWGKGNMVRVTGRLSGDTLDMVFDSTYCARHYTLKKSG